MGRLPGDPIKVRDVMPLSISMTAGTLKTCVKKPIKLPDFGFKENLLESQTIDKERKRAALTAATHPLD